MLAWWDERGRAPTWEPPAPDMRGWARPRGRRWQLRAHPLSTSENSVDLGHFTTLHGFDAVELRGELRVDGPYLGGSYTFGHRFARALVLHNQFDVHLWGLGYSLVENHTPSINLDIRLWILATPTRAGWIDFRIATSARERTALFASTSAKLIREFALLTLSHDVKQDFDVWQRRTHIQRPALARGDGPIGQYRKWARQFDPRTRQEQVE